MNRWTVLVALILLGSYILCGCSGGKNPVSPENPSITPINTTQTEQSDTWLLGYYDIFFDLHTQELEVVENRTVDFTLNIVPFLNKMTVPNNGITFSNLIVHDDDPSFLGIDVDFNVHHPFPGIDQYNAYDLRGIVIGNGGHSLDYSGLKVARHEIDLWMKNPDGYSRWFNPTDFTSELIFGYAPGGYQNLAGNAHVNPYKYYGGNLGADDDLWDYLTGDNNHDGIFSSGAGRRMELEFPMPPLGSGLAFGYAIVVAWEDQGPGGPFYPYHPAEAIAANIAITENLWIQGPDFGGDIILDFDLFAWEQQPDTIKIESTVLNSVKSFNADAYAEPGGDNYSTYHFEIPAEKILSPVDNWFWLICEYNGFDYSNGTVGIPYADGPLCSFFRHDLPVGMEQPCDFEITYAVPESAEIDTMYPEFEVHGVNFINGTSLAVKIIDGTTDLVIGQSLVYNDSTFLTCEMDFNGIDAGFYDLEVTNGCYPPVSETIPYVVGIACDNFEVTSADPNPAEFNSVIPILKVFGQLFQYGDNLAIDVFDGIDILASGTLPVTYIDETELRCEMDLAGIDPGTYELRVTNGCNPISTDSIPFDIELSCDNFNVTSADPSSAEKGEIVSPLTIYGEQFQDGANLAVDLLDGAVLLVSGTNVNFVNSGEITCDMDFDGVDADTYFLRVRNGCYPNSYDSIEFEVTVGCDSFKLYASDPSSALVNQILNGVEITGEDFQNAIGPQVHIMDDTTVLVTATNVNWISSTEINCSLNFTGIAAGFYDLRVTNGCSPESTKEIPFNVFVDDPGPKNAPAPPAKDIGVRDTAAFPNPAKAVYIWSSTDNGLYGYDEDLTGQQFGSFTVTWI